MSVALLFVIALPPAASSPHKHGAPGADIAINAAGTEILTSPGPLVDQGNSFTVTWYQSQ
jgi:hypothetical protein